MFARFLEALGGASERQPRHVFLSPHYDDVAFSLGGLVHAHAARATTAVVTCFAAAPAMPVSPLAVRAHRDWGMRNDARVTERRAAENRSAVRTLGASVRDLPYLDAIYRHDGADWSYRELAQLFAEIHPADEPLAAQLAEVIGALVPPGDAATVYCPLGLGAHVDHVITRRAGDLLHATGRQVVYYEEMPYALKAMSADSTAPPSSTGHWTAELLSISAKSYAAHWRAIRAYRSQIAVNLESEAVFTPQLARYMHALSGDETPTLRLWRRTTAPMA